MAEQIDLPVRIFAPAKINLFLHINDKSESGYHILQSIICFTNIGDTVEIKKSNEFSFHIDGPFSTSLIDEANNNLVVKAVSLLAQHLKRKPNLSIKLHKSTPIGAGLGGGSSDAAATIKGLLKFWQTKIKPQELQKILIKLGADVPACYADNACYIEGIGDIITPIPFPKNIPAIVVYPHEHCATKDIFAAYAPPFTPTIEKLPTLSNATNLYDFIKQQRNDLTAPAIQNIPIIQGVLNAIEAQEGCEITRMSGSGSACFGLFHSEEMAQHAAKTLKKEKPNWWVRPVQLG